MLAGSASAFPGVATTTRRSDLRLGRSTSDEVREFGGAELGRNRLPSSPRPAPSFGRSASDVESGSTVAESITITDNRTGESLEIPIDNGGVDAAEWRKLLPGIWFHDPGLATTSGADSAITELDGENGILATAATRSSSWRSNQPSWK